MNNRWLHIVLIFMLCTIGVANVHAQNVEDTKVTIEVEKVTMSEFLNKLSEVAKLSISFSGSTTDKYTITLSVKDQTLKETLELAFKNTPLQYTVMTKGIMVFEPEKKSGNQNTEAITVAGTVTDNSGNGLPGVSILLKETTRGTTTDANGKYSIEANENDVLIFSFIGYKKIEEAVGSRIKVDMVMAEDINTLEEVVINGGYYETTDKLKTGSIVKVTAKDIEKQPVSSPLMALQGRVAGLDVAPEVGTPGAAPTIRIRGNNSLRIGGKPGIGVDYANGGNFPLYVIDGVAVNSAPIITTGISGLAPNAGYDPLSTLNTSNIESIEVLKDGDATAIYGSRGANGVILITTKRNKKGTERVNLDLRFYSGAGKVSKFLELLNTSDYIAMRRQAISNDGSSPGQFDYDLTVWDTTRYTDWQKVFFGGTANVTDMQANLSGGSKTTTFSIGGGYHKETLVFPGDFGYQKANGNASINHVSTNQKFSVNLSTNYGIDISNTCYGDFVGEALKLAPNAPRLYDQNGNINWEMYDTDNNGIPESTFLNPMGTAEQTQKLVNKNLLSSLNLGYEALPGLSFSINMGGNILSTDLTAKSPSTTQAPKYNIDGQLVKQFGSVIFQTTTRNTWTIEPKVSLTKQWGMHNLSVIAVATWQQNTFASMGVRGTRYVSDASMNSLSAAGVVEPWSDNYSEYKYVSQLIRAGYNFNQKYLANLTVRRDGSSRFGPDNRFGYFWSAAGGWIFSEEAFLKKSNKILSFGKLRASYGLTGSDGIGDYRYYDLYSIMPSGYQGTRGFTPYALYNPEFSWEVTRKLEAAIELSFFENRISTEINWYRNRSSNQLVDYPLPATTGFPSVAKNFEATVQNTGTEFLIRGEILSSDNWQWSASINLSLPRNKLLKFDGIENSPYAKIFKVGEPTSIQSLYEYKGVNPSTGLYEVVDQNQDGKINESDRILVNPLDKNLYGGLSSTIGYKNIQVSLLFQFARMNGTPYLPGMPGVQFMNQPVEVLKRWQQEGDITDIQRFATNRSGDAISSYVNMLNSDRNITDASFFRFKTLSINYQLPLQWIEKVKLQQASIFLQGQNLFTLTKYEGLDPETKNNLPPLLMITLGVQLKF